MIEEQENLLNLDDNIIVKNLENTKKTLNLLRRNYNNLLKINIILIILGIYLFISFFI